MRPRSPSTSPQERTPSRAGIWEQDADDWIPNSALARVISPNSDTAEIARVPFAGGYQARQTTRFRRVPRAVRTRHKCTRGTRSNLICSETGAEIEAGRDVQQQIRGREVTSARTSRQRGKHRTLHRSDWGFLERIDVDSIVKGRSRA